MAIDGEAAHCFRMSSMLAMVSHCDVESFQSANFSSIDFAASLPSISMCMLSKISRYFIRRFYYFQAPMMPSLYTILCCFEAASLLLEWHISRKIFRTLFHRLSD